MKKLYILKKKILIITTLSFILLTLIEYIKYFFSANNIFGLIYLVLNIFIIFLIIPITKNYNKYYSGQRISKLIMIIVIGLFSSFILNKMVFNMLSYKDASQEYINSIFIIKNILKTIIYILLSIFTYHEFTLQQLIQNEQLKQVQNKQPKKVRKKLVKKKKVSKEKPDLN
jgi:Na+/proline symporter